MSMIAFVNYVITFSQLLTRSLILSRKVTFQTNQIYFMTKKCQWACHSIRHVQQNKAKLDALHYGSGTTAKMYFQCDLEKVSQATLVRRVCLSMQTSFWWNKIASLRKKTYFTTSYGCDWDPKDSLSIAEYVWNNFQMTLFGCYLGNPYPKLL